MPFLSFPVSRDVGSHLDSLSHLIDSCGFVAATMIDWHSNKSNAGVF